MRPRKNNFLEYCNQLRGYQVFNKNGFEVYKYELFYKRVSVEKIKLRQTEYILKHR